MSNTVLPASWQDSASHKVIISNVEQPGCRVIYLTVDDSTYLIKCSKKYDKLICIEREDKTAIDTTVRNEILHTDLTKLHKGYAIIQEDNGPLIDIYMKNDAYTQSSSGELLQLFAGVYYMSTNKRAEIGLDLKTNTFHLVHGDISLVTL